MALINLVAEQGAGAFIAEPIIVVVAHIVVAPSSFY